MIADIQATLKSMIYVEAGLPANVLDIRFATPTPAWVSGLTTPTLNFFLHNIHENTALRSMEFAESRLPTGAKRHLAPRRINLQYLVMVFFKAQLDELGRDEWTVLWRVLTALLRQAEWDERYVPDDVRSWGLNVLGAVGHEAGQYDSQVFTSLGLPIRPHLTYTLTVPLELGVGSFSPFVMERQIDIGTDPRATAPALPPLLEIDRSSWQIRDRQGELVSDALVRADSGARGFTDASGVVHLNVQRAQVRHLDVLTLEGQKFRLKPEDATYRPPIPS